MNRIGTNPAMITNRSLLKGDETMMKLKQGWLVAVVMGLVLLAAMVVPASARSISMKDAGVGLWIFLIIGAMIILLQAIPAAILFFSFIGTTSFVLFKGKKAAEKVALGAEPAVVEAKK